MNFFPPRVHAPKPVSAKLGGKSHKTKSTNVTSSYAAYAFTINDEHTVSELVVGRLALRYAYIYEVMGQL